MVEEGQAQGNFYTESLEKLANDVRGHYTRTKQPINPIEVGEHERNLASLFIDSVKANELQYGKKLDETGLRRDLDTFLKYARDVGTHRSEYDEHNNLQMGRLYRLIVNRPVLSAAAVLVTSAATVVITETIFQYDRITNNSSALRNVRDLHGIGDWINYFADRPNQMFFNHIIEEGTNSPYWPLILFPLVPFVATAAFFIYKTKNLKQRIDRRKGVEKHVSQLIGENAKTIAQKIMTNNFSGKLTEEELTKRIE